MTKISKVRSVEILACDAGWRNYHFLKITTEDGIVGWSEFDEGFGSPGLGAVIQRLSSRVVGQNAFQHERIRAELFAATRPGAGGVIAQALGAIENALLDAKAKLLGVPAYELLGGKSATASGSTGRIAPPGASIIRTGTSRRSPVSTASRRSGAKSGKRNLPR